MNTNQSLQNSNMKQKLEKVKAHLDSFPRPHDYQPSAWEVLKQQALNIWEAYLAGQPWDQPVAITCKASYHMLINREGQLIVKDESLLHWVNNRHTSAWATRLELIAKKAVKEGDDEKALRFFQKALKVRPRSYSLHYQLAHLLEKMGKLGEALQAVNTCIAMEPRIDSLYLLRGLLHEKTGHQHHALYDYNNAIRLDPTESKGLIKRSLLLKTLGKMDEAQRDLEKALALQAPFSTRISLSNPSSGSGSRAA